MAAIACDVLRSGALLDDFSRQAQRGSNEPLSVPSIIVPGRSRAHVWRCEQPDRLLFVPERVTLCSAVEADWRHPNTA